MFKIKNKWGVRARAKLDNFFFKAPLTRVSTLKGVDIAVAVAPVFSLVSESGEINMPRKQPKHALHVTVLSITDRIF